MVISSNFPTQTVSPLKVTWEPLLDDILLEDDPVENVAQPLIAGALREALELSGYLRSEMLVAANLGICATVNGALVIKAPDWFYAAPIQPLPDDRDRRSYTPHLEGEVPRVVMEFLSETDGGEYSAKRTFPLGKWCFYEQILQVPVYVIFSPSTGSLEVHLLQGDRYELVSPNAANRYWLSDMDLALGVWQGEKEGRSGYWLRWWDEAGQLLPWATEQIAQERQLLQQERQLLQQERQRAERLADLLRAQGIDPDEVPS